MKTPILKLLATAVLLAACSSGSDSKSPMVAPAVKVNQPARTDGITFKVERSVTLEEDLSNLEDFERGLNTYKVTIRVPTSLAQDLKVGKIHQDQNTPSPQILSSSSFEYDKDGVTISDSIDLRGTVLSLQNFEYEIENEEKSLQPVSFSIKPDLVIVGSRHIADFKPTSLDIEVGALFLDANSSLITEDYSLSLKAETIISKDASIETFTEAQAAIAATQGERGQSGGNLKITTNLLVGNLNVFMRGQNGGKGMDGIAAGKTPDPAAGGQDSGTGDWCVEYLLRTPGNETQFREMPPRCEQRACSNSATNGQPGGKGPDGNDGQPGAQGGDSGIFEFTAVKSNQNKVTVNLLPGAGGSGGTQSLGSPGGAGGPGGASRNRYCSAGLPGPQGPNGRDGNPGAPGPAGAQQKSTITLNGKTE